MRRKTRVYKFGGASVSNADAVKNVASILGNESGGPLLIVVSAMGKTTNALERLTRAYIDKSDDVQKIFSEIKDFHWEIAAQLFDEDHEVFSQLNDLFVEVDWILEDEPHDPYDYTYDQIVSTGEFLSTRIVSALLQEKGVANLWVDARDVIKTDNAHREARVDWDLTKGLVVKHLDPVMEKGGIVVTQGFIGCTSENFSSTLGREGSDYSAAIFANMLDAESLTIWKDVPGIMTGDPKIFENVTRIDRLSYREAIEMTYYGAKVIHPKTIKPLQNKSIPLFVRSFEKPSEEGTWVGTDFETAIPPVIVLADDQVLIHIATKDYSFVAEHHLSQLFGCFARHRIRINLMRNTAISFSVCCNAEPKKIDAMIGELEGEFTIAVDRDLQLLTVRHANDSILRELLAESTVIFEEKFGETVQCVVRAVPAPRLRNLT